MSIWGKNRVLIVAVEPKNSPVLAGGEPGFHKIQGIGAGCVPENLDTTVYDEIVAVSDEDATIFTRRIAGRGPAGGNLLRGELLRRAPNRETPRQGQRGGGRVLRHRERYLTTDLFQAEGI